MDEQILIHAAQRGNLEAFNELVLLYQDFLYRVAVNIIHDEEAAEDATQQTFLSAFRNIKTFRGGSLRSWLCRILVNASYDELRRVSRAKSQPLQEPDQDGEEKGPILWLADPNPSPEAQVETGKMLEAIKTCLEAMPRHYRLVVSLIDVDGFSYDEAAMALGVPVGTIKSRLARARNALRTALQRYPDLLPDAYTLDLPMAANVC
jgi:RNA polymerase sigma-70 factor (ECF subfamily)